MQDAAHLRDASGPWPVRTIEHAADNVFRACITDAGGPYAWTDFDALAASRAGVEHAVNTVAESRLEGDFVHRLPI